RLSLAMEILWRFTEARGRAYPPKYALRTPGPLPLPEFRYPIRRMHDSQLHGPIRRRIAAPLSSSSAGDRLRPRVVSSLARDSASSACASSPALRGTQCDRDLVVAAPKP